MAKKKNSIYVPYSLEGYELCHPLDEADFENIVLQVNGVFRKETWNPIAMEIIHEDEGQILSKSDSPWLGSHVLILRREAVDSMKLLLEKYGELLPVRCDESDLFIFNPTNLLDALDENSSSIIRFNEGQIMYVKHYVFFPEIINGSQIFKIPSLRASPIFLGDQFVKTWNSLGLRGLGFTKVWTF